MQLESEINKEMLNIISSELAELEKSEDTRILFAVESGSRAWGFASPDSDYDIRFVYIRKPAWYMRLDETRDVIEWKLDDVLDISGWDIQKALRLMRASNPSLMEWLSSPIFYRPLVDEKISDLANRSFNPVASCHHYLNMAKNNAREHLKDDTVKLKKYFYTIRPILAARHVLTKRTQPPMFFDDLMDEYLDKRLIPIVQELLDMKRKSNETLYISRCEDLNTWIYDSLEKLDSQIDDLPRTEKIPWVEYNKLFQDLVGL